MTADLPPGPPPSAEADLFTALLNADAPEVARLVAGDAALLAARSPSGLSPVLFAAYYQRPEVLRALLAAHPTLDLHEAAAAGQAARVGELLDADPDLLNAQAADGFTPLALAALFGQVEVAALLLSRGADASAVSGHALRGPPLYSAVMGNHAEVARLLLDAGADVNAAQAGGFTPLMAAAQHGNAALVRALLAHGADVQARTDDGRRAADLAREEGHRDLVPLLTPTRPEGRAVSGRAGSSEENGNAAAGGSVHTAAMTKPDDRNADDLNTDNGQDNPEVQGGGGAQTGFFMRDEKDEHQEAYTSTPAADRVGAADHSRYVPAEAADPHAVTGAFDHLATRDVKAMETAQQDAEYAGAQTVAGLGAGVDALHSVVPDNGIGGVSAAMAVASENHLSAADRNPHYTPPSNSGPVRQPELPGDLPQGEKPELRDAVKGDDLD